MATTWNVTVGDLYPPYPGVLSDSNGPVNIASPSICSGVEFIIKGPTNTISGAATILQVSFTATVTANSTQLTSVSSLTGLWLPGTDPWATGSTLYCPGNLAAPTENPDSSWTLPTILTMSGSTITMSEAAPAGAAGGTQTIIANIGTVEYPWQVGDTVTGNIGSYSGGWQATWASGSKPQFFPSDPTQQVKVAINALP